MSNDATKPPLKSEPNRIVSARFVESVPFAGTEQSYAIAAHGVSITPAKLEPDGQPSALQPNQRADGLLLDGKLAGKRERVFVPFANVRGVTYSLD